MHGSIILYGLNVIPYEIGYYHFWYRIILGYNIKKKDEREDEQKQHLPQKDCTGNEVHKIKSLKAGAFSQNSDSCNTRNTVRSTWWSGRRSFNGCLCQIRRTIGNHFSNASRFTLGSDLGVHLWLKLINISEKKSNEIRDGGQISYTTTVFLQPIWIVAQSKECYL